MARKGIILAGGSGTRLHPITHGLSKQLLPVYDKPMIYYPISVLMLAGIQDILIITTPEDQQNFVRMLGDGSDFGINIQYAVQEKPTGLPEAFIIAEKFLNGNSCCLVLGDNIFYGQSFSEILRKLNTSEDGATIFAYYVRDPERYGVIEFDKNGTPISIEEKPENPKSNYSVTGLYFFDNDVVEIAKNLKPSKRGETEIIDVIKEYLNRDNLYVQKLGRGFAWLDTGTHDSLLQAAQFVQTIDHRQGLKIACLEEIALENGWISTEKAFERAESLIKTEYGLYLKRRVEKMLKES